MVFMIYTNGTRIDDEVADRLKALGNVSPTISLEGWEEETDARRGKGTFQKVIAVMNRLKQRGVFFGTSLTITRNNVDKLMSDEFLDFLIDQGVKYVWSFHYVPIGRQPDTDLMILPEQRAYLSERSIISGLTSPCPLWIFGMTVPILKVVLPVASASSISMPAVM